MSPPLIIAVDAMGGDRGPATTVPAVVDFLQRHPDTRILLYGIARELPAIDHLGGRLTVVDCPQRLEADERPTQALRHKRESSLWRALVAVAEADAAACVSGGETGAMMAMGVAAVGMLPGLARPAICTLLPTAGGGRVGLLDLGANVDCDAELLHQFARMGAARLQVEGVANPRVALLNVGAEGGKGNRSVKAAAALLEADPSLRYIGFVEGDQVLLGAADLVVCDGFVGNVALKSIEGVARLLLARLRGGVTTTGYWRRRLVRPLLDAALSFLDPARYNGASLLGLRGVVVKSHGAADAAGFGYALEVARTEAHGRLPERIAARLAAAPGNAPATS